MAEEVAPDRHFCGGSYCAGRAEEDRCGKRWILRGSDMRRNCDRAAGHTDHHAQHADDGRLVASWPVEDTRSPMADQRRYCIISDDSGHDYLCPADRRDEAVRWFAAIEAYWAQEERGGKPTVDLDGPDYVTRLEGGELTFTDPRVAP